MIHSWTGQARLQSFDTFGNSVGGLVRMQVESDHDWGEWTDGDPPEPVPAPIAEPVERLAGGPYQWRGSEGSQTDRRHTEQRDRNDPDVLLARAETEPSTGGE